MISLTSRHVPRVDQCLQDELRHGVRHEMEVQRVLAVEEDALHQRHHGPARVVAGAHDRHVDHLALGHLRLLVQAHDDRLLVVGSRLHAVLLDPQELGLRRVVLLGIGHDAQQVVLGDAGTGLMGDVTNHGLRPG